MSSFLYSVGRRAFAARKTVLLIWLLVLAIAGGGAGLLTKGLDNSVSIPGTEAQNALDRLAVTFPQTSGAAAQVLAVAPDGVQDPAVHTAIDNAVHELENMDGVISVISPYQQDLGGSISEDGQAALINAQLEGDVSSVPQSSKDRIAEIAGDLQNRLPEGAQASHGGPLFSTEMPGLSIVEALGLLIACVVLIITLGSFVAAGMPLINALLGVGISTGLIFLATSITTINATTPLLALMLGLAVGIDYALFIVSRYQQELADGSQPQESAARATATAGSAVIFAGITVIIALFGLGVAGIPFLTTMGIAAAVGVGIAVLVSVTLMPALLGFARNRIRARVPKRAKRPFGERFFGGWVRAATRFPIVTVALVIGVLGLASVPAAGMRLGMPDSGALPKDDPARVTYDRIGEHFPKGFNGPLIVTGSIVTSEDPLGLMDGLKSEIERMPGVAEVPMATPNPTADTGIVQVVPESPPEAEETKQLVEDLRAKRDHFQQAYGITISVTGFNAVGIDVSDKLGEALVPFAVVVVGLSLILLTMVFRSIAVPIKATLGYLLSIGSSLGIVTLVFQHGWLAEFFGVTRPGPVISFMPIVLMGVLFGLAMDYEVFLVTRMREEFVRTRDARSAIAKGFVSSAGVVTAAAVIMFAVFIAFVPQGDANLKPIAMGMAIGVFVDAFIVRMTLVPAVLALLGDRAWWMPRKLDRVLPSFDVEGENLREELELADWPSPGSDEAIACEGLRMADPSGGDPIYQDVGFLLPHQAVHVVRGKHESAISALLLTLSGRLKADGGKLKVLGYVLPARASSVRSHVAYVDVGEGGTESVRSALAENPAVLVLDRTDRVSDPAARLEIRELLTGARPTVLAGTTGLADVRDILPGAGSLTELRDDAEAMPNVLSGAIR